jgi:hypothetical protein
MNVLSDFAKMLFIKAGYAMTDTRGDRKRPVEGYLIAGAALALLLGIVILKARVP